MMNTARPVALLDETPDLDQNLSDIRAGLNQQPKTLPPRLFYDQSGAKLFEEICRQPEYYLTRTELAIMQENASLMAREIGKGATIIEPGSGAGQKIRILLDNLDSPLSYIPVDISAEQLEDCAQELSREYPNLLVRPVIADFTQPFKLPLAGPREHRRVVYFPGSTIGNFEPPAAFKLLQRIRQLAAAGGALLIGVDLQKDPEQLRLAYNDAAGVTAQFNLNMLARINREFTADFDLTRFKHQAVYQHMLGRIEMRLISSIDQCVRIRGSVFSFKAGEYIVTEHSYKWQPTEFARLVTTAGFAPGPAWFDENRWFMVQFFTAR
jgi:dimethylhistidine N-methyltransferase